MANWLQSISLLSTPVTILSWAFLCLALLATALIIPRDKRLTILLMAWLTGSGLSLAVVAILFGLLQFTFADIKPTVIIALSLFVCAFLTFVASIFMHWRSLLGLVPIALALVSALLLINQAYVLYPDVRAVEAETELSTLSISDLPTAQHTLPLSKWSPPKQGLQEKGALVQASPSHNASGFHSRDGYVYLPPAWFTDPRPQLPVLVLMPGTPGEPIQWFTNGEAATIADQYQATHDGISPIIASIDTTGSTFGNPLCTDSPEFKVSTFITQDLPTWLKQQFSADPNQSTWTLGGLSYGGTCALQTTLNYPGTYGSFLDFSGEITPNDGVSHYTTVKKFFNGSEDTFQKKNPETILKSTNQSTLVGRFVAGKDDSQAITDLTQLNEQAIAAGADTSYATVEGGHNFTAWRNALSRTFGFIIARAGLPA